MFAEVGELDLDERSRRGGDEHLSPVAGSGDARGAMDVAADIALIREQGRAGMQADPHVDLAGREGRSHVSCCCERTRSGREGEEEGVTLSVHLDPAMPSAGLPNQLPVFRQCRRVGLSAEFV